MAASLQFKFREGTTGDDRRELIAKLEDGGAEHVERIFPDEDDEELATLYRALVKEDRHHRKLLRLLKRSRKVEFAETEPERSLIAPVELEERAPQ